jgi:hypothetical protein
MHKSESIWQKRSVVLLDELGVAFITTTLLALIAHIATRKEILDDVVKVSLGYVLPESLRPAIRWIYGQRIICERHEQRMEISSNPEIFIVKTRLSRTFRNMSNDSIPVKIGISIDEWFENGVSS